MSEFNQEIKKLVEMGGIEWNNGDMNRVYLSQGLFNQITGIGYSLNEKKAKFYYEDGKLYRKMFKKPNVSKVYFEGRLSEFEQKDA